MPSAAPPATRARADLVIVAPTGGERVGALLAEAHARLAGDGVAYLLIPPTRPIADFDVVRRFAHLPDRAASRHLVPAATAALRYAFDHLVAGTSFRGRIAARLPAFAPAVRFLPASGAVACRDSAGVPLAWLQKHVPEARLDRVILSTSQEAVVLRIVDSGLVVKVGPTVKREADALVELGPAAQAAGVTVPEPRGAGTVAELPLHILSNVEGRPASIVLARRPDLLDATVTAIAHWLDRWNRATAREGPVDRDVLERCLLRPAASLARELPDGSGYVERLQRLAQQVEGTSVRFVAAHQDLTMANVLLSEGGGLGVVDWATAAPHALPLGDLCYAVVDAHAASQRYADPAESFSTCFITERRERPKIAQLAAALGLDDAAVELCFHACWLGHAQNEARRPEGTRPFLRILSRLTEDPSRPVPVVPR